MGSGRITEEDAELVVGSDALYIWSSERIFAFDLSDGSEMWRLRRPSNRERFVSLVEFDDLVFVGISDGTMYLLLPSSGSEYRRDVSALPFRPIDLIVDDDQLYAAQSDALYEVHPDRFPTLKKVPGVWPSVGNMTVANEVVYQIVGHDGNLSAVDVTTGEPIWISREVDGLDGIPSVFSWIVAVSARSTGLVYVFEADSGQLVATLDPAGLGHGLDDSIAFSDRNAFIVSQQDLSAGYESGAAGDGALQLRTEQG